MKSIKISSDIHYVVRHEISNDEEGELVVTPCHNILCQGEEDSIERVSDNPNHVTCQLCHMALLED